MKYILWLLLITSTAKAQEATWIWYPGDFEIWLGNKMQNRRTERGAFFPPFWKLDSHFVLIDFQKDLELTEPETVSIFAEGEYNVKLDGKLLPGKPKAITVPAGKHRILIKVFNQAHVPAIYVKGKTVISDTSWLVTNEDKEWIDETGKTSDQSGTKWLHAGCWNFNQADKLPSAFRLETAPQFAVSTDGSLVDFGKETFGFVKFHGLRGKGKVQLYYGESKEEALSATHSEIIDELEVDMPEKADSVLSLSKAFRYVNVQKDAGIQYDSVSMLYEYLPLTERGSFRCSDEQINRIYDVSKYTFRLNTREFFIDGIKRDRWIWSGDAYQSYLMNYYLYFDSAAVTRTLLALRGKDPVTGHINTIMDYTFYWFLGIYDYYYYTGDQAFIRQVYPAMQSLMDYCLSRRNKDGLMEGLAGDWIFIDWAEGLSKKGEVSFEQLLLCRSLETMQLCAKLVQDDGGAAKYGQLAEDLRAKLFRYYWNGEALVHSRVDGKPTSNITRYANMFAIFFDYLDAAQRQSVKQHVLLNNKIPGITTPYMRFYELEALCAMGEQAYVLKEMRNYWGAMLDLGVTTFWEEFNPAKKGTEHFAMYGRPFGKSLCHAWGASPLYLLGKYFLGVKPLSPGYETYLVAPETGGLQWIEGKVPVPGGTISVYCSGKEIRVQADSGMGILRFKSSTKPRCAQGIVESRGAGEYELKLEKNIAYTIYRKA